MYAKLINGSLNRLRMPLKIDGNDVFTNDVNVFMENGYKPVKYIVSPSETAVPHWEETDAAITQVWETKEEGVAE